jgi:ABC-type nitrate/sulfonate/bicarbonate transport system permease component
MVVRSSILTVVGQLVFFSLLMSCWEIAGRWSERIFFLVGTPTAVGLEFGSLLFRDGLVYHFFVTGSEA